MKNIILYEKDNGKSPFKDFIKNLNIDLKAKIYHKIKLLTVDLLGYNDVKYLKEKIYELRIKDQTNIVRIFYFLEINDNIIVLDGFIKKDNKLKKQILDKIIGYKNDYLKRIGIL